MRTVSAESLIVLLQGEWQGKSLLQLSAQEPVRESESRFRVKGTINNKFIQIDYDWSEGGKRQEGLLLIGLQDQPLAANAVWMDSWHMGKEFMILQGTATQEGRITVLGSYQAPDSPDWGWRISIWQDGDQAMLQMDNISPEGEELWAVKASYTKTG